MMKFPVYVICMLLGAIPSTLLAQSTEGGLALEEAIRIAIATDPWLAGSRHTETALTAESVAAGTLPDPALSLTASNLPVDTFDFGQEPMTQLSLGVSQMFPRGDTLELSTIQKQQLASQHPLLREDRQARVAATVSQLWLEAFRAQESIRLIKADYNLFEQLVDVAEASYSTALGRTRQQDLVRAQLELTRLEDRLTQLNRQLDSARQRLSEWIGDAANDELRPVLPELQPVAPELMTADQMPSSQRWYERLRRHPAVLALDRRIAATGTDVDLARQKYKPEWGVTAKYGYRDQDPAGRDRADFFTFGLTFDLPLFTANRQDQQLSAAVARKEAIKTDKSLLLRELMAQLETRRAELRRLNERDALYRKTLLPQIREQAEASLAAYNNDDGDFPEAVRARIDELNAKIDALTIAVEREKTIAQINYLLALASQPEPQTNESN